MLRNRNFILLLLFIDFVLSWIAVFYNWWLAVPWIDIPMHIIGAFLIALLIASYYSTQFSKLSQPFAFFTLLGLCLVVGVLWEFHEYILNHSSLIPQLSHSLKYSVNLQGNVTDTIKDLANDCIGAILASLYIFKKK